MSDDHLHAFSAGCRLHEYEIGHVLGIGDFGMTYLARDTQLKKLVAIKECLPAELALRVQGQTVVLKSASDKDDYDWGLTRFLDEASSPA